MAFTNEEIENSERAYSKFFWENIDRVSGAVIPKYDKEGKKIEPGQCVVVTEEELKAFNENLMNYCQYMPNTTFCNPITARQLTNTLRLIGVHSRVFDLFKQIVNLLKVETYHSRNGEELITKSIDIINEIEGNYDHINNIGKSPSQL